MTTGWEVVTTIAAAELCIADWPIAATRLSRANAPCWVIVAEGERWDDIDRENGHIRRRANENRKRNKAARRARRLNRGK